MPTPSRWLVKTALLYFALALGLGLVRAAETVGLASGVSVPLWLPQLHALTVGWLSQIVFGVAFWLFPRPSPDPWGRPLIWGAYAALNLGLVLRFVSEPALLPPSGRAWGLLAAAGLQWGASLLLAGYFWWRLRA
jgi:hypothetical protein